MHSGIPAFTYNSRWLLVFFITWLFCKKHLNGLPCPEQNRTLACFTASLCDVQNVHYHPSYVVPLRLLHLNYLCILLSYDAPYLVTKHPLATLPPTELHWILFLSSAVPSELHCTLWAMLQPTELLLHFIELYHTLFWATLHPVELSCSLLSYQHSTDWAMLYPSELRCSLLSLLRPIKLRCTLFSYAVSTNLRCALCS